MSVSFRENDVQALLTSLIEALDKLLRDFAVASLRESGLAVTLGFATPSAP